MKQNRFLPAHENWVCLAGAGECLTPAIVVTDDGSGGDAYWCQQHWEQAQAMEAFLDAHPEMMSALEAAIDARE